MPLQVGKGTSLKAEDIRLSCNVEFVLVGLGGYYE